MASSKLRMCRMCLSTGAILRSLFTIFQDHNLVFIIRDYVRLEVKKNNLNIYWNRFNFRLLSLYPDRSERQSAPDGVQIVRRQADPSA